MTIKLTPAQTPPEGDWSVWLHTGGRAGGKTFSGAHWMAHREDRVSLMVGLSWDEIRGMMIPAFLKIFELYGLKAPVVNMTSRQIFQDDKVIDLNILSSLDSQPPGKYGSIWIDEPFTRMHDGWVEGLGYIRQKPGFQAMISGFPHQVPSFRQIEQGFGTRTTVSTWMDNVENLPETFVKAVKADGL